MRSTARADPKTESLPERTAGLFQASGQITAKIAAAVISPKISHRVIKSFGWLAHSCACPGCLAAILFQSQLLSATHSFRSSAERTDKLTS